MATNDGLSKRRAHTVQLVAALVMVVSGIGLAVTSENHWLGLILRASGAVLAVVALIELRRGRRKIDRERKWRAARTPANIREQFHAAPAALTAPVRRH